MNTQNLSKELDLLQNNVIGLFKNARMKDYEMVLSNDNGFIKTISISKLGGLHTIMISSNQGKLIVFEDNKTLTEMMEKEPYKLQSLINEISNFD